jgi:hypothetical protein
MHIKTVQTCICKMYIYLDRLPYSRDVLNCALYKYNYFSKQDFQIVRVYLSNRYLYPIMSSCSRAMVHGRPYDKNYIGMYTYLDLPGIALS